MMIRKLIALSCLLIFCGMMALPLAGCRDEGPAERMGRDLDEAGEEMRDAAEDLGDRY